MVFNRLKSIHTQNQFNFSGESQNFRPSWIVEPLEKRKGALWAAFHVTAMSKRLWNQFWVRTQRSRWRRLSSANHHHYAWFGIGAIKFTTPIFNAFLNMGTRFDRGKVFWKKVRLTYYSRIVVTWWYSILRRWYFLFYLTLSHALFNF